MKAAALDLDQPLTVCGIQIRPDDTPEQFLQKLASIAFDEILPFVFVLSAEGAVLGCNRPVLESAGIAVSDVLGQPLCNTFWFAAPLVQAGLCDAIRCAAAGQMVRKDLDVPLRLGGEAVPFDFTLRPLRDERDRVVFLLLQGQQLAHRAASPELRLPQGVGNDQPLPAPPSSAPAATRVLVADDNADMRDYLRRMLGERYDVQVAADGEAALEAARLHPPELILSDVMMPRLDGFSLLRELRADPGLREIPVILLSARAAEESRIEVMEAGADDYLLEPFSVRELIARVETQIRVSRIRSEASAALRQTESGFRTFANAAPAMLWLTEPDGSFSFFSRGWREFTGQSEQAALGFGWLDVVHPEDRRDAREVVAEAIRGRQEFSVDFRLRAADGSYRWVMNSARPRFTANAVFCGYTGSVIDIHERKQASQASALLSAIVDSCDDAIISKDLNGVIRTWNKSAERLFGYTAEEAVGQSIVMLIPPDRLEEEPQILDKLRRGERVDHFETIRVCKDGSRLNISLTISPVKDASGRIVGASKVARDITERVRHEQSMQEANAALQRANGDLQQFVYSASHDLQEPLRMVAAYSELLKKKFGGQLGPTGDQYIGHAVQGALRMEKLLKDLRTYTQFSTAGQAPVGDIDAAEVLKKTLLNLEVAIRDSGASISFGSLPWVRLHEFQLEQVFQNLIANAIRYRSYAPPRICVAAVPRDENWLFSVEDNGIGIDPQFKEQVFGIFKRLHSTADYPGTGMGLAICQRIIERAGGRIWVDSEPGRGSTFYFTVPFAHPAREGPHPENSVDSLDRGQPSRRGIGA